MTAIAKLWGQKIIEGTKTYAQVPSKLKESVKEYLESMGYNIEEE